jgi:CubicO group peptidase (beta-lactamase class C family)
MIDTCYNNTNLDRIAPTEKFGFRGLIHGKVHDEKGYLLGGVAGHAGIYSTIKDLSIFAEMLLNKGSFNNISILNNHSLRSIQNKSMKCEDESYRSIGWIVKKVCGQEVVYHTGYTGTNFMVDFKNRISFILLSNRVHPTRKNTKIIAFRKELENIIYKDL